MAAVKRVVTQQEIAAASDPDALIDAHVAAALAGFAEITIRQWARMKPPKFPQPVLIGRNVRWRAGDVRAWSQARQAIKPPA